MNSKTHKSSIAGPAGALDIAIDLPAGTSRGFAVIAHPHPLFGGTLRWRWAVFRSVPLSPRMRLSACMPSAALKSWF